MSSSDQQVQSQDPQPTQPVHVFYCKVCTFPVEYCEFGSSLTRCKEWLSEDNAAMFDKFYSDALQTKIGTLVPGRCYTGDTDTKRTGNLVRCTSPSALGPTRDDIGDVWDSLSHLSSAQALDIEPGSIDRSRPVMETYLGHGRPPDAPCFSFRRATH
ncbi:hypothetical protein BV22DRAFT_907741 [Leucogyrophana mollusca]|uniref:Uncharacterized protein n=1 Tax=Leucogyrophana mollusca TaxID=85980 RepID=A0ACB8B0V3_9AGAM|nr:hypothetical protein BV22DRAFT_907741 [Leucogyrophana mollusca]